MSDTADNWYLSGPLGIDTREPPQQLSITGGIGFANHNAADKQLYSPADGVLEWMTSDWAGQHGFGVSHQREQRVFLNTAGNSYFNGGNVGIGTTTPKARLEVSEGAIMPAAGNSENAGILFPKDPGRGAGDAAWIRYYARSGEATTLEIGTSNDAEDHIALMASGGVGIGTNEPKAKLDVSGPVVISGSLTVDGGFITRYFEGEADVISMLRGEVGDPVKVVFASLPGGFGSLKFGLYFSNGVGQVVRVNLDMTPVP